MSRKGNEMLYSAARTNGYRIWAMDGEIGRVRDLLFDDRHWVVRYLVVNLGHWMPGREVLLSADAIGRWEWAQSAIGVSLTREQIEHSPDVSTDLPVARQHEEQLARHYGWPMYWATAMYGGLEPISLPPPLARPHDNEPPTRHDPHLRSTSEVCGYRLQTADLRLGQLADLLYDADLAIRLLELHTHRLLPGGQKLVVPPTWVGAIEWNTRQITLALTADQLVTLPPFEPGIPADEYTRRLTQWQQDHHSTPA